MSFDADDWAKEDCVCGHRRFHHKGGDGACIKTRMRKVQPPNLPKPVYEPGREDDWTAWPVNWPPHEDWPEVEGPCCAAFYDAGLAYAESREPE